MLSNQDTLWSESGEKHLHSENQTNLPAKESIPDKILKNDPRQAIFDQVKQLQKQSMAVNKIARDLNISRNTVRMYFALNELPSRTYGKSTHFDVFADYVLPQLQEPDYIVKDIIDQIKALGYTGSRSQAYHRINQLKQLTGLSADEGKAVRHRKIPYVKPLSSRQLSRLIGQDLKEISDTHQLQYLNTLLTHNTEFQRVRKQIQVFRILLKTGESNSKDWIDGILNSEYAFVGLKTFAWGLLQDLQAVQNAIQWPWSNGPVEGHVNRIKCIKRTMYGRAGFDLLRKKVILSNTG
ncbi:transposase [Membranihabitans maritimus]|uniref:transposase n=1 Tax=Membranihabitans maritimus TaxID=2904244 RepID=UPI001F466BB5|nr:transposase [Membranihabitans maritimus]